LLPIYNMPGHLIRRLHQQSASVFSQKVAKAGEDLTPVQYGALCAVRAYPGLDQATVASMIAYDRVTIGGVLDRLEQKELLTRGVKEEDKRSKVLFLTAKGKKLLQKLDPVVARVQLDVLQGLSTTEQKQFRAMMVKVLVASGDDLSDKYLEQQKTA
jgi:MarR family transcriptional regulator, temperature-dependent positive regulator of motility